MPFFPWIFFVGWKLTVYHLFRHSSSTLTNIENAEIQCIHCVKRYKIAIFGSETIFNKNEKHLPRENQIHRQKNNDVWIIFTIHYISEKPQKTLESVRLSNEIQQCVKTISIRFSQIYEYRSISSSSLILRLKDHFEDHLVNNATKISEFSIVFASKRGIHKRHLQWGWGPAGN